MSNLRDWLNADGHVKRGTILFYAGASLLPDLIIRLGTGTYWAHCAVALGDGKAIQSNSNYGGVCKANEIETCHMEFFAYPGDVEALIAAMERYLGEPYDFAGLFCPVLWNIPFLRGLICDPWAKRTRKWFCSSLIAQAFVGGPVRIPKPTRCVCPQDIYNALAR